ncbi:MAG: hypothetical protein Q7K54_02375 [Candidatus Parcubacteria bacterium]|nr:hypothetical protein [Candidatus Parcubacteria bacterium]
MTSNRPHLIIDIKLIEKDILILLEGLLNNKKPDYLSETLVTKIIEKNFSKLFSRYCEKYDESISIQSMVDLAFVDKDDFYYIVDAKIHELNTRFNALDPIAISVEHLSKFYEEDKNYFMILKIDYLVEGTRVAIKHVTFAPIEFFGWDCLTLGALGWGQIQIANANVVSITPKTSRKNWMLELCDTLLEFYPKEIGKIGKRIDRFKQVRKFWEKK